MLGRCRRWSRSLAVTLTATAFVVGCGLDVVGRPVETEQNATEPAAEERTNEPGSTSARRTPAAPGEEPESPKQAEEPLTMLSPSHPSGSLTFQRPIDWTIGALDPDVPIHFTTDGTRPTKDSPSKPGRVDLRELPDGTRIQWIAGESDVVHTFDVRVDEDLRRQTHAIVEDVRFDLSGGPVVKVAAGSTITGKASAVVWNGPCPNCIDQVTLGITTAALCIVSLNPQVYPGAARNNVGFTISAPTTPGTYKLKTGFTQQYRCQPDAIGTSLGETEVGTIIVE